jgi:ketosteroid isomerase-like protein
MSNSDVMRGCYAAFVTGDLPAVLGTFADDIEWVVPGRTGLAGVYKGTDEVVRFFTELGERSAGSFTLEVIDVMESGDRVIAVVRERAARGDRSLDVVNLHYWEMRDGKATRFIAYEYDQYLEDEFYGAGGP